MFAKRTLAGILTHVFFITLFLIVPMLALVRPPGEPFLYINRVFVQDTTANFVLLGFFYLNYFVLIPKLFFKRKYVAYVIAVVVFLMLAFTLPYLAGKLMPDMEHPGPFNEPFGRHGAPPFQQPGSIASFMLDEFRRHVFLFFSAVFFSFLLRTREHLSQIKEEKLEAELSSLKAQINPHFLFNTLNSIYALSVKKDDRASQAIIHLSGLMRYVIKDANDYKIPLRKELEYLGNYVELQKARLGATAQVIFTCSGEPAGLEIAPLILVTYIENAFKYGINPDEDDCIVEIDIFISDTGLQMKVINKKVKRSAHIESSGIGMNNTKERLKHLYPDKHSLKITEDSNTYTITLSLDLA